MNKFATFVKENYGLHKKNGMTHNEASAFQAFFITSIQVMKILSAKWKEAPIPSKSEIKNDEIDVDISILSIHD